MPVTSPKSHATDGIFFRNLSEGSLQVVNLQGIEMIPTGVEMISTGVKMILPVFKIPTKLAIFGLLCRIVAHDSDVLSDSAWVKTGYRLGTVSRVWYPSDQMEYYQVSRAVNSPSVDKPSNIDSL